MPIKLSKSLAIKHSTLLAVYLIIVWGFYRFLFKLPDPVEELFIKPVIWLAPVAYFLKKEKLGLSSLGITSKNLFPAIYFAIGLGVIFAIEGMLINSIKHGELDLSANIGQISLMAALGLSLVTAISEELAFRGFVFNRMWFGLGNEWTANIITSLLWALVHVPIALLWWNLSLSQTIGFLILTSIFGFGSAFVFARTKNVLSSILLHVLWSWPIILFR